MISLTSYVDLIEQDDYAEICLILNVLYQAAYPRTPASVEYQKCLVLSSTGHVSTLDFFSDWFVLCLS